MIRCSWARVFQGNPKQPRSPALGQQRQHPAGSRASRRKGPAQTVPPPAPSQQHHPLSKPLRFSPFTSRLRSVLPRRTLQKRDSLPGPQTHALSSSPACGSGNGPGGRPSGRAAGKPLNRLPPLLALLSFDPPGCFLPSRQGGFPRAAFRPFSPASPKAADQKPSARRSPRQLEASPRDAAPSAA